MVNSESKKLLKSESQSIKKLRAIVEESIKQEKSIVTDILEQPRESLTVGQKISDKVANFGGSWKFIISFVTILILWIIICNSLNLI